ncbi:heme-degrading domain-containing protein [Pantoea sp. Ap-967]|uniref:heme-degrading domain-containing protein n=1 Tax=Pantoea sp. Ap-967 TaxID=2608362 RepID=UPI0014219460|nr:heme-degrading domain-containing protein [Pantoea sp. Ap-967]NIE77501.1 heme-degrading domain-containing protein [Pantoea sp. Ap-967]
MDLKEELALLVRQEQALQFEHFDEHVAWKLGSLLYNKAVAEQWPLVIDVRRFDRPLFLASTPGVTADNHDWVRRKTNSVQRFLRSTYRIALQLKLEGKDITQRYHLPAADYAGFGGGFPISVRGAGVIGCVTVSGLPHRQDHQVVVEALCSVLNQPLASLGLPPEAL